MKKAFCLLLALVMCLSLSACGDKPANSSTANTTTTEPPVSVHSHEWKAATCTAPKTCLTCGATEGDIGTEHEWKEATCTNPKTCVNCNATEGEALAHNWTAATCSAPKTCTICNQTEGAALEHKFTGGNCSTFPTCSLCGATGSQKGDHSYNGSTCSICGAVNASYDEVKNALKSVERYPKYLNANYDLIDSEHELYDMTGKISYFNDAHKHVLENHDYLQKVIDKCKDYKELDMLTERCEELLLEMPTVPASTSTSAVRSYMSSARSYARKCKDVAIIYNVLCDNYGLPKV